MINYNHILDKNKLHYMDTDSFVLIRKTENIFKDLRNLQNMFDFSKLEKKHETVSNEKKKSNWKI